MSPPLAPVIPDAQQLRTVITRIIAKGYVFDSGAPAAPRAAKRSSILIWETKGNPLVDFLMVIMASGIARGRVRTTTTTTATTTVESRKMAAIVRIIG